MEPKTTGELREWLRQFPDSTPLRAQAGEDSLPVMFWFQYRVAAADLRNDRRTDPWMRLYVSTHGIC